MTNIAHLGSHTTNKEHLGGYVMDSTHFSSHATKLPYFASYLLGRHLRQLSSMRPAWLEGCVYLVSMTILSVSNLFPSAWFNISDLLLFAWFSILSWIHPCKSCFVNIGSWVTLLFSMCLCIFVYIKYSTCTTLQLFTCALHTAPCMCTTHHTIHRIAYPVC